MNQLPRSSSDPPVSAAQGVQLQSAAPLFPTGPMLLWLMVQAGALAIAALRIPLWAQPPSAQELTALKCLAVAQIGFSSLLFPMLMSNWQAALATIAATWPFVALAGLLAAADFSSILSIGGYVTGWLAVLALLRAASRGVTFELIAIAAISIWTIGGPVLLFVHQEYGIQAQLRGMQYMLGPITEIASAEPGQLTYGWPFLAAVAAVGVLLVTGRILLQKRVGHRQ